MAGMTKEQAEDRAPVIRDLIKHENDLVNQRLTWLTQTQALLFAALGFSWENSPLLLTLLIAVIGLSTTWSIGSAIAVYDPSVRRLYQWWKDNLPAEYPAGPHVIGIWLPPSGCRKYLQPWRALPWIFAAAWIGVLGIAIAVYSSWL